MGAIVGGLVAGIFAALALAGLAYWLIRRYRQKRGTNSSQVPNSRRANRSLGREASSESWIEGSHPLLHPAVSQVGGELGSYSDNRNAIPITPHSGYPHPYPYSLAPAPTPRQLFNSNLPPSSSMMQEIPTPESPTRPSLPPLVIPPDGNTRAIRPSSGVSSVSDDTTSVYSQASASTRLHQMWVDDTDAPPVPSIPPEFIQQQDLAEGSLLRGNTEKVSRLLKSRARRAHRGKAPSLPPSRSNSFESVALFADDRSVLGRSTMTGPPMETLPEFPLTHSPSLTIRNPFENSLHSRSTSVATISTNTSIANHAAYMYSKEPPRVQRLSVVDNEDAEMESLYAEEISTVPITTRPLRVVKEPTDGR